MLAGAALLTGILQPSTAGARVYQTFADVADKVIPGVVNIRTTQYVSGKDLLLDPYQFFLKGRSPRTGNNHSLGSGVIVSKDGVHNQHSKFTLL